MAFVKDRKAKELIDTAVDCAEHIMDEGFSRNTAISTSEEKFGISKGILERKVSKRNTKRNNSAKTPKEMEMSKADGIKILVTK